MIILQLLQGFVMRYDYVFGLKLPFVPNNYNLLALLRVVEILHFVHLLKRVYLNLLKHVCLQIWFLLCPILMSDLVKIQPISFVS